MNVTWTKGVNLSWKEVGVAVWLLWMAAGGWWKLDGIEKTVNSHLAGAVSVEQRIERNERELQDIELILPMCCPQYHKTLRPVFPGPLVYPPRLTIGGSDASSLAPDPLRPRLVAPRPRAVADRPPGADP